MTFVSTTLPISLTLDSEEEELRKIAPSRGAFGENASDYLNMYDMFMSVIQHAKALSSDPNAFLTPQGTYNDKIINAYKGLMGTAIKAMTELNKMRNADKMTAFILDSNTRDLVGAASVEIGMEIKKIIDGVDSGNSSDEVVLGLKRLMYQKLPKIFTEAAQESLEITKETYGLH